MTNLFTLPVLSSILSLLIAITDTAPALEDDFSPGLLIGVLLFGAVILVLIGAGAVIAGCMIVFTMISLAFGILSASVLAGYLNRSITTGLKTLVMLLSGLLGIPMGIVMVFVLQWIKAGKYPDFLFTTILPGSLAGLLGGVIIGLIFLKAISYLREIVVAKYRVG